MNFFKTLLAISLCILFFSCSQQNKNSFPEPKIKSGIARVSGKLTGAEQDFKKYPEIQLRYQNPFTPERITLTSKIQEDGTFLFEVPIECSSLASISSPIFYEEGDIFIGIGLVPDEESKMDISFEEGHITQIDTKSGIAFTLNDIRNFGDVYIKMIDGSTSSSDPRPRYDYETFDEYVEQVLSSLEKRIKIGQDNELLSQPVKNFLSYEIRLIILNARLFDYEIYMELDYKNECPEEDRDDFVLSVKPELSDYSFLSYFNLNDPLYLYGFEYDILMQHILWDKTLNIPRIEEKPVSEWLAEVKGIMADLLGFDKGLFYDMLTMNAYIRQFDNESKPLSKVQKTNIQTYFKDNTIAKVLLERNEKIVLLDKEKNYFPLVVNDISEVNPDQVKETILSKYKGKNIMMDLWGTWCPPCMEGIKDFQKIRPLIKGENIILVYIVDDSSPKNLWQEKINSIGGEHYYLTKEQSNYFSEEFEALARPTYLFFDTKGQLQRKVEGLPDNDTMIGYINELLGK